MPEPLASEPALRLPHPNEMLGTVTRVALVPNVNVSLARTPAVLALSP